MFHIAKHAIKFIGYTHDYDISSTPIDEKGIFNDLILTFSGLDLQKSSIANTLYFAPNVNSIRRLKKLSDAKDFDGFLTTKEGNK